MIWKTRLTALGIAAAAVLPALSLGIAPGVGIAGDPPDAGRGATRQPLRASRFQLDQRRPRPSPRRTAR